MGDHNAVDWAQELHCNLLKASGLLLPRHVLIYPHALPRNSERYFEGVMIDDRVGVQIVERRRVKADVVPDSVADEN